MFKKIRTKLVVITSILLLTPILILGITSYLSAKSELDKKGEALLKNGVRQVMQLIEVKKGEAERGEITEEEAKEYVRVLLLGEKNSEGKRPIRREIDLGKSGYFIAYTSKGLEAMHPSLEGQDVWEVEEKGGTGFKFVQEQIKIGMNGGGFLRYAWTLPNSEKIGYKISYQEYDKDWDWVVSASAYEEDFNEGAENILMLIGIVLSVSSVLGLLVIVLLANNITKPIQAIASSIKKMSEKDLDLVEVQVKSRDEIRVLGDSYNRLLQNLRGLVGTMQNTSGSVAELSGNLLDITKQSTRALNEVTQTIQEVAEAVSEESAMTEQGAVMAEDLAGSIEEVAEKTKSVEKLSKETEKESREGLSAVENLIAVTGKSNEATRKIAEVISKVEDSTKHISVFTSTITGIADQTNLLALNASIEAARAGEVGRGFAVVAEEIRKLAEQSSHSVHEIRDLISEIERQSSQSSESLKELETAMKEQNESVVFTKDKFTSIERGIRSVVDVLSGIQKDVETMNLKKEKIVDAMTGISASTEEVSASTEEVSASTEEQLAGIEEINAQTDKLNELAKELEHLIKEFRL
ncbi:methyl-accepting chemotaxis protein [Proteiniclasticum ruminis]|uniref:Methyl-accepting chemotaxis sensory transducer with Cache sensor n=1 Tax=Proteiniclasticum ruminis TaxID=398199 RepID=A0A1I5B9H1_9CLOT|nr:methyl-accepting chemotaxis protein [Proteiniclasticum ruminis]SFN71149.1 methyl-accepting chemotaxis sensory transducer with Cache sensor [Proteiniclasticum ruminis]